MAFRFRSSIKIAPGVRLNLSRSGVSTTLGGRGLSVNVGRRGTWLNAGIPGSGISSRSRLGGSATGPAAAGCAGCGGLGLMMLVFAGFCGALIGGSGGGSGTPSLSTADTAYTAWHRQRVTLYAHGRMNIRSGASTSYPVVQTLSRGESVEVGPKDGAGWAAVYGGYGSQIGYVYRASPNLRSFAPPSTGTHSP